MELGKLGPTQGHVPIATCRPFSGRGVTILLVSERRFFLYNNFKLLWSPVDIGNLNSLKISHLNFILEY